MVDGAGLAFSLLGNAAMSLFKVQGRYTNIVEMMHDFHSLLERFFETHLRLRRFSLKRTRFFELEYILCPLAWKQGDL